MDRIDCAVIGAGVVGLAAARALALAGHEVLVLEAQGVIGAGISSRSSEVIHAGLHHQPDWLKVRLCVRGRQLLYAYLAQQGVPYRRCGKLVVATSSAQTGRLEALAEHARGNGVGDLTLLERAQAVALEPALRCQAALLSPSTGIVDSHALMLSLQGDLERAGGMVVLRATVVRGLCTHAGIIIETADGARLHCARVVNAAGLAAPALARCFDGVDATLLPMAHFAKGSYFTLAGRAPFSRLIYPLPEPGGLGVHLTLDLGGQARFGPDVQWVARPDDLQVDPARGQVFCAQVRQYWPALPDAALQPGYAGIRPKITGPGQPEADFRIDGAAVHGVPGLVNLLGIESPGLTSCLAIGEQVARLLAG
jgi:L-2-hydroxyglutarate oxidase LhgO